MASEDLSADEPRLAGRVLLIAILALGVAAALALIGAIGDAAYTAFTNARASTDGSLVSTLHVLFLWPALTVAVILGWILPTGWFATLVDQAFDHALAIVIGVHVVAFFVWIWIVGGRHE